MKTLKYIIATIFIALVVYSNTAKADILNPVKRAEVKNFLEGQARVVYALEVCESDIHIPVFKRIMDVSYVSAGAYDEGDKMIVDMLWPALWSLDDPDKNGITTSQMVKNLKQLKVADFDEWTSTCKSFEETIAETYLK